MAADDWKPLLEALAERQTTARAMGGEEKLAKHHARGKFDARTRIDKLVDAGSFNELGTLVGAISHQELPPAPADGIVGGTARINGRPVVVASEDFTVQGGSIGLGAHAKRVRLAELALRERAPMVMMLEGAGERATNGLQRYPYAPNDLQVVAKLRGQVPTVAIVLGASAGHGALSGVLLDFIVMTEQGALFSAGPPLVAAALGEQVNADELGGAQIHTKTSGVAHNAVADEMAAFDAARRYLSYLPQNVDGALNAPQGENDLEPRQVDALLDLIPTQTNRPYDMAAVLAETFDAGSLFAVQPDFGRSMITALARLGGTPVAVVANQPKVRAGAIDRPAAQKATRFIRTLSPYRLPFIFVADNPGVLPGSKAEKDGALLAAADMFTAQAAIVSPKLHVTMRKAFGFGSSVMAMNPFDQQTVSYALPGISLGGLPALSGGEAANLDEETQAAVTASELEATWRSADTMAYDEIIDPRDLRSKLMAGLDLSRGRL